MSCCAHVSDTLSVPYRLFSCARPVPVTLPGVYVRDVLQDSPGNVSGYGKGRDLVSGAAF